MYIYYARSSLPGPHATNPSWRDGPDKFIIAEPPGNPPPPCHSQEVMDETRAGEGTCPAEV